MAKKAKRSTTEDESSPGNSASSSEDISREETARRKRRRSQARRSTSKKERSYSQGKEMIKFLAEVKEEVCKQSKQVSESKEEMSKQLEKLREEMCKQSKQVTESKEEMCKQSKQATESKEEICKQLEKVYQDNQEMRKQLTEILTDLCKQRDLHTNSSSGDDSDAPRSQLDPMQPPRYRLVFKSAVTDKIEKGQLIDISVALVDGNDQTIESGPLASATVEVVVVDAEFNQHNNQHNWSREDFEIKIKKSRQGNSAAVDVDQSVKSIVSDGRFNLVQGFKCHSGCKIFRNSGNKKVRLGVMVVSPTEERVLEGLSNAFFVRGHDRLRHNKLNMQRQTTLVDDGYEEQNVAVLNTQNPSWATSTQYEEIRSNITGGTPQLSIIGNTTMLSPGQNITVGQPQLPFLGNTTTLSVEPSTSQEPDAWIQQYQVPHSPTWIQARNNQTDELSAALVGNVRNPNIMGNDNVPPIQARELPGRDGATSHKVLPPGFRFHPTDMELIFHYLCHRGAAEPSPVQFIAEVDIYKFDPWDLSAQAVYGDQEWYFFSPLRRYPNSDRPNRAAGSGYWKGWREIPLSAAGNDKMLGFKKTLVFYIGHAPKGIETSWIMEEYRLYTSSSSSRLDERVLCKIYNKPRLPVQSNYEQMPRVGLQLPEFLPLGFRFCPTDEELISHYLRKRATAAAYMAPTIIAEVDINKCEPWDLPSKANFGESEWYFFSRRDHNKCATGARPNRATESGCWKATGKDRTITVLSVDADHDNIITLGYKKTFVFYMGRAPMALKTKWLMVEYRLHDDDIPPSAKESASSSAFSTSDEWFLYKIYTRAEVVEPNQLTTPFPDDCLIPQLQLQDDDDDFSNSFLAPALSTMPSTLSSISDCITNFTYTPEFDDTSIYRMSFSPGV